MSNFSDDMFVEGEDLTMVDSKRIAITIDVLKVLNDQAIENSYNQQLTEQFFVDVDRRFPAYLKMYMKHMHREGVPCEVHMRTIWEQTHDSNFQRFKSVYSSGSVWTEETTIC